MNTELMDEIARTPGRLDKEALLAKVEDPRWIRWALDPAITFRVTVDEEEQLTANSAYAGTTPVHDGFWKDFEALLEALSSRAMTGNAAELAINDLLQLAPTLDACKWACRVINKDLRCNFGVSTVTKVFPGLIEPFACMLAHPYDPSKHALEGAYIAQRKLDGLRMVVVDGVAYTRTGKVLESVGHILAELEPYKDFVFDGEVMGEGGFDTASGKTRKKGSGPDTSLVYHVFDVIPLDQWNSKKTDSMDSRLGLLAGIFFHQEFERVKYVPWTELPPNPTFEHITSLRDSMISEGYEGCMLKNLSAPYCFKRSNDLLKFKFMNDVDCIITGYEPGKGKHKGKLGAFTVDYNGVASKVGSGYSDAQREDFWSKRDSMIGTTIEVAYQNLSDSGCLRFPVFVRQRKDKDD